ISIPVMLLWQSQLKLRQKLVLGATLSLSIFMIIITIIRGSIARVVNGAVDTTWQTFWLETEACVGIIMVSMTAVRTLFVADTSKKNPPNNVPVGEYRRQSAWKKNLLWDFSPGDRQPMIEKGSGVWKKKRVPAGLLPSFHGGGATMTGMRTMIRENGRTTQGSFGSEDMGFPLQSGGEEGEVRWTLSGSTLREARSASGEEITGTAIS
ncbi:MAG: hypothetical protein Q9187_009437, partial [Circinaria calcarea]